MPASLYRQPRHLLIIHIAAYPTLLLTTARLIPNRIITVKVFDKNNKLCINITNTYAVEPIFVNNTPVSDKAGHGIGIRSIISVIEKYNGVYDFFAEDGLFYFQACI